MKQDIYDDKVHFTSQYVLTKGAFAFDAHTYDSWIEWQQAFRPRLREILGLDTLASGLADYQPRVQRYQIDDMGDHYREYWRIWTEPTVPLPFYLLRPKTDGPYPLVFTPHGHNHPHIYVGITHNEAEKKSVQEGERDIAVQAVQQGYLAIAPTTRAFGETRTEQDKADNAVHSCRTQLMHDLLVGRTPIGDRVWDISMLLTWALESLPIDAQRVAITGNSGGGTISVFAAACDERITVAVPSSYFCTFT
ncbi:MAG: alpha/beta hydrolase family protein, partial [Anaerolineae bacterium]|nr:alpha/beta hydrolase family protein [Anaerolineae bacterium]